MSKTRCSQTAEAGLRGLLVGADRKTRRGLIGRWIRMPEALITADESSECRRRPTAGRDRGRVTSPRFDLGPETSESRRSFVGFVVAK
jgi:hypothetical protein